MRLFEVISQPSQKLIDATMLWIKGWNNLFHEDRLRAENKIWDVKDEAMQFISKRNRILYRGMSCTNEQMTDLINGKPISVPLRRLSSWTTQKSIAFDFCEGLVIKKTGLKQVLDITKILSYLPSTFPSNAIQINQDDSEELDEFRYAQRECEIICEHSNPLIIYPEDVVAGFDPNDVEGNIVNMKLKSKRV